MDIVKTLNGLIEDVNNGGVDTLAELQRELIHLKSELEQLNLCAVGSNVMPFKGDDIPDFYDWLKANKIDFWQEKLLYKGNWYFIGDLYIEYKIHYKINL
jgi:hypothetical protein